MKGSIIFLPDCTDFETKHSTKHVLYCMLCFRFYEAQRACGMLSVAVTITDEVKTSK